MVQKMEAIRNVLEQNTFCESWEGHTLGNVSKFMNKCSKGAHMNQFETIIHQNHPYSIQNGPGDPKTI